MSSASRIAYKSFCAHGYRRRGQYSAILPALSWQRAVDLHSCPSCWKRAADLCPAHCCYMLDSPDIQEVRSNHWYLVQYDLQSAVLTLYLCKNPIFTFLLRCQCLSSCHHYPRGRTTGFEEGEHPPPLYQ